MEIWREIRGYEGIYQVSDQGNIRSIDRIEKWGHSTRFRRGRTLVKKVTPFGYEQVGLWKGTAKQQWILVHRLVADAFIPNINNLPQVNHKDEDKRNNAASNEAGRSGFDVSAICKCLKKEMRYNTHKGYIWCYQ